jgi:hypothetical protein
VNVASADPLGVTHKIWFESTRDAFTAFCGEACFPVLYDYGSSLTLHPRSFREMLARKGYQPKQVGTRAVSTSGFSGAPVVGSVPIYCLNIRLWDNSVPVEVLSYEFPDHQTNIKTLLLGRVSIWTHDWFPDRDPEGKPALRSGRRYKPLVRAKEHLYRPSHYDLHQPDEYQRPDQKPDPQSPIPSTPDFIGSIDETGGWSVLQHPRPVPKGALRSYGQYLALSMKTSGKEADRGC